MTAACFRISKIYHTTSIMAPGIPAPGPSQMAAAAKDAATPSKKLDQLSQSVVDMHGGDGFIHTIFGAKVDNTET